MQYRSFPKIDWKPSALGFGAMRLPIIDNDPTKVNVTEAVNMIRYAIDNGVNYVDTAYFYHGGNSEIAVGQALKDGYRQKIRLATKFPAREANSADDFDRVFQKQLERLQVDSIDFYLLHGLQLPLWVKLNSMGILKWLEAQQSSGKIRYVGFSFHDEYPAFQKIVDAYDNWTFCQIHYNFMDDNYQAGTRGLEYAASKNIGVIVMEPLRGGLLARRPPQSVEEVWKHAQIQRSPVEWALRWVWDHPQVSLLLSGMSTMQQVEENVEYASRAGNSHLNKYELDLIERVKTAYKGACPIPCTGCRYCMPCPNGVAIPQIFRIYSEMTMYDEPEMAKKRYSGGPMALKPTQWASNCVECGKCVEACPQRIDIPTWLKKVHSELKS